MTQTEQQKYDRESCDICSNRFNCSKVEDYDKGEEINLHNCSLFEDVFCQ